ncbi:phage major capsid protein [Clostridium celatum]|uniref:phage major capsid protein n=1 Tax=Clostridium celatum TaxID=36834 RepID=UPI0028FEC801|nr:phage major capsid protein [Clostridium celatum]MDU2266689.1 phage major capsid protein [Clostridium celatum]MDU6297066.1 phage major capsid protein [Clostridium celatum]
MGIEALRQLLEQKKVEARSLLETDLAKAEKTMEEVREIQKKIALYEEIEDEEKRDLENQRNQKNKGKGDDDMAVNEMRAITKSVMGHKLTEEERAAVVSSGNAAVLPKQFINQLQEIKKGFGSLKENCDVITVTKNEGTIPVVDYDQNELSDITEGSDIVDGTLVTTELSFKCKKVGLIQTLSSELVEDAEVEIEEIAKTNFTEIAVVKENKKIMDIVNTNATAIEDATDYTALENVMAEALPAVKSGLITLCNVEGYAHLKNMKDKQGRNMNLITTVGDTEYFNGKPIVTFDSSLVTPTPDKKKVFYSLNMKEAVKFIQRKDVTIARSNEAGFNDDTIKLRILERFDVTKGSTRSIKKIELA